MCASVRGAARARPRRLACIAGCTRRDAEDAFGPSDGFSGTFGPGRRHLPAGTGPMGVHVRYAADDSVFAVAFQARVTDEHLAPLGAPDDERISGLGPELRQLTWAARGLIVHRSIFEHERSLVIGCVAMPLETLRASAVFHLSTRETLAP